MTGLEQQLSNINRFLDTPVFQQVFLDRCDILNPELGSDGHSGHTTTDVPLLTDIPCLIEWQSSNAEPQEDAVNERVNARIYMKLTDDETLELDQHQKIRVVARGPNPELIFEQPVRQPDSTAQLVVIQAILQKGFRRPGTL